MDIQVGDRIAYKYLFDNNKIYSFIIRNTANLKDYERMKENNRIEILKIERPKYEVVEEKKELLTEEEREFLRLYIKLNITFQKEKINYIYLTKDYLHFNYGKNYDYEIEICNGMFLNLKREKNIYALSELGLEGK